MPEKLSRQPIVYTPRAGAVTALAASPWAPLVAVAGQKQIALYNTDTGATARACCRFPKASRTCSSSAARARCCWPAAASGGKLGTRRRVRREDRRAGGHGRRRARRRAGGRHQRGPHADRARRTGPRRADLLDRDGELLHEIRKHTEWIYAVEFSPDGVLLATADRNGGLFVWEAETAREYQNLAGHKGGVTDVSWRPDSNVLASASEDGTIKLWEMEGGKEIKNIAAHGGGVTGVEFAQDGKIVSTGRDRLTKLWDPAGAAIRDFPAFGDLAMEVAITHDAGRVIAGDWLGEVRLWNTADGAQVANMPPNPPTLQMLR